jgi:tetratricopeptide (TPR) repeat protein
MTALSPYSVPDPDASDPGFDPPLVDHFAAIADDLEREARAYGDGDPRAARARLRANAARADLVRSLYHAQRYADAAQAVEHALARDPARAELRYLRARLYERSGRIGAALAELDWLERSGHRSAITALLRSACHETAGERGPAVRALARAAPMAEAFPSGVADVAAPWRLWRDPVLAEETAVVRAALERRIAVEPDSLDTRLALAELLLDLGAVAEAAPHVDVARSIGTGGSRAALIQGRERLANGAPAEAARAFDHAIAKFGEYADLRFWAGLAYEKAGNVASARHGFERALARNRTYAMAWLALALLRFRMKDGDEAARLARQATVRHREPAAFSGATLAAAIEGDPVVRSILLRHAALYPDYPDLDRAARGYRKLGEEGTQRQAVELARLALARA